MAETKAHARTQGPWWHGVPEPRTGRILVISRPARFGVAVAFIEADAALIAAAPELLEALSTARRELSYYERTDTGERIQAVTDALAQADAAIAKAEGASHG